MTMRRKFTTMTAQEGMAILEQDPEYLKRRRELDEKQRIKVEELQRAERPLVEELNAAGVFVNSIWDLVNTSRPYPAAIPVLASHLSGGYPIQIREGIARALTEPYAGEDAYHALVKEFKKELESDELGQLGYKWALQNAISIVAKRKNFDEIVELIRDRERHKLSRDMLILGLARLGQDRAIPVLIEQLEDEEVAGYALQALRRSKYPNKYLWIVNAKAKLEYVLNHHPQKWVRKEAQKLLERIEREDSRQQ